jgi:DMSO/TMAO reductase YedYZ molybdopterin-dependent catalytic subunit
VVVAGLGLYVSQVLRRAREPVEPSASMAGLGSLRAPGEPASPITPNEAFYVVSKNFLADPNPDPAGWTLAVDGLVDQPLRLELAALRALTSETVAITLECIGNPVGGDLIGTALWRGVPLARLLELAGAGPTAQKAVFVSEDSYSDSLDLERARHPGALIAYEMNGAPLPARHGGPLRLVMPGHYGLKSVKWLRRVRLLEGDYQGFWQVQGWSREALVTTMARIDSPADGGQLDPTRALAGVAFAGDRGIARVEVSLDDGQSWRPAALQPPLSPYTWTLWTLPVADGGVRSATVRAVDGTGTPQDSAHREPLPEGGTGYHRIALR